MNTHNSLARTALAVALAALTAPAFSQAALEEIIVTAQKREQSLQDVPIAISALSGDALRSAVVNDIFDLRAAVPDSLRNSLQAQPAFTHVLTHKDLRLHPWLLELPCLERLEGWAGTRLWPQANCCTP